jgi:hypothetical protein
MDVGVAEGTSMTQVMSEGAVEDVVLAKQRGMMRREWLLEKGLSLSTEVLKGMEAGGEWKVADGDPSADRPDNDLLSNRTGKMQSAHLDGSNERVVRLDDDDGEDDDGEDDHGEDDHGDDEDDGDDECEVGDGAGEMIEDEHMGEEVGVESMTEAGDTTDGDQVMEGGDDDDEANVGEAPTTQGGDGSHENPLERPSKKQKAMLDVRRLSDLAQRDEGRRWETIPELTEEEGRLLWMCFQGIVSSENRAEIGKLPAYFERCEAPPPDASFSELHSRSLGGVRDWRGTGDVYDASEYRHRFRWEEDREEDHLGEEGSGTRRRRAWTCS